MKQSTDYRLLSKLYFRLLPYQVLMLVINAANGIVDSLFASNFVGKTAMSAIGFYSPLNHFLFAVSIMLVSGSQLLVGRAMGKNRIDEVQAYFSADLLLSAVIAVITGLLLALSAAVSLFGMFVKDAAELRALNRYMLGQSVGIPALVLGQQFFSFLSLENQTKRTMAASLCCVAVNTLMNLLLVPVLGLGTLGLGLGSSAGLWTFCGVMAHYYLSGKSDMQFSLKDFSWRKALEIFRLGYAGAISRFVEMIRCFIVNLLILQYVGSGGLSAFAASNSVMAVFWPIPFGMVAVTRMLLGISIGEEDRRSVIDTCRIFMKKGFLFQCGLSVLILLLAEPLTMLFYRNPADEVYRMTVMGLRILPLCMPLAVISLNFACYAQAAERKFLKLTLPVTDGMVGVTLCSFLLIPALKMNGLYIANVLNGFICFALIFFHAWHAHHRAPRCTEDLLALPESFGAAEDARIDIEVREMEEVMAVSGQVIGFCRGRGVDERRSSLAGLAMEEMAGNIVSHGFTKDRKKHSVSIRVVHKDDDVILRLRDDCRAFDPLERAKLIDPEDKVSNIGLRIVRGISKDVRYQNLLGLNVLTIRI